MEASSARSAAIPSSAVVVGPAVSVDRNGTAAAERTGSPASPGMARSDASFGPVELPDERRLSASTLAGLAAASGVAAIVLGAWAFYSGVRSDGESGSAAEPPAHQQAVSLLARGDVERLPLSGSVGRVILVVEPSGDATLVLNGLSAADSQWAYQAWVFQPGVTPANGEPARPAALFSGREALVPLTTPVPPGATVAVTLEPAAGSFAPTRTPRLVVVRPS